jgi:hypothetical protein
MLDSPTYNSGELLPSCQVGVPRASRCIVGGLYELPSAEDEGLVEENASKDDWISRDGRQRREQKGVWYRRKADFVASTTDPDSSPMKRRESKGSHLGYYNHYG